MPYRLLKFGLSSEYSEPRMFPVQGELRDAYDVVIIGGGGHGLAAAHYLATEFGITNVAVLEKGYLGRGGNGTQYRDCAFQLPYAAGRILLSGECRAF